MYENFTQSVAEKNKSLPECLKPQTRYSSQSEDLGEAPSLRETKIKTYTNFSNLND